MSQVSIIDIEGNHPQIPTQFDANVDFAIPLANVLEIFGSTQLAGTTPVHTVGSGNNITAYVQLAQAIASTNATNVGLAAFNSADFSVDANGFVSIIGSAAASSFTVDASTAPGTNPVVPNGSGIVTVTGGQVAAGTTVNVIRTNSLAANTYAIQIQRSSAQAASTVGANGVSHFNSTEFTVDSNGFVSLIGGSLAVDSVAVQTGTSPVVPTSAGLITINGAVVSAGTNPVRSNGTGANTLALEIQISQAIAATDATKIGLCNFNSAQFSVDSNGFVSLAGGGVAIDSIGTQTGTNPIAPTAAGLVTINGAVVAAGTNPIRSNGTGANTMALEVQISQALAATDITKIGLANFDSSSFGVDSNGFVTLSSTGAAKTITGDTGGAISPVANNWNIVGGAALSAGTNASVTSGSGSTLTVTSINCAKWIVDPTANRGTHTTIAGALSAASTGQTITIRPGTYTENLNFKAGVNLTAFGSDSSLNGTGVVIIAGSGSMTTAGTVTISGIQFQNTSTASPIIVSGSAASVINLQNCYFNLVSFGGTAGITFSSSSSSAAINLMGCSGNIAAVGISLFTQSSAGTLSLFDTKIDNSGGSSTANTQSAGVVFVRNSLLANPISSSSTATTIIDRSNVDSGAQNVAAFTCGGSGTNSASSSYFSGGSASAVSIGSTLKMTDCTVNSTNTNAVTGAGTLTDGGIFFANTSSTINTSTVNNLVTNFGSVTINTALPTASGGTGLTTSGASGNVLTSNGTSWTSAAPAATFQINVVATGWNPLDATTYYILQAQAPITAFSLSGAFYVAKSGTLTACVGQVRVSGTLGSSENVTIAIRLNDTTNTNVTTTLQLTSVTNSFSNTSLSIAVSAGDFVSIQLIGPTWVTNPTLVTLAAALYIS